MLIYGQETCTTELRALASAAMTTNAIEEAERPKLKKVIRPCHAPGALGLLIITTPGIFVGNFVANFFEKPQHIDKGVRQSFRQSLEMPP